MSESTGFVIIFSLYGIVQTINLYIFWYYCGGDRITSTIRKCPGQLDKRDKKIQSLNKIEQ